MARTRRIHLINPRADTFATRPLFFGKALYSPVAGLLAIAALIPEDEYEVILWFEMMRRKQIVSFDWDKYDQSHIVFKPAGLSAEQFYNGYLDTYDGFYTLASMIQRFPWDGSRNPANWAIYNAFFRKGGVVTRDPDQLIARPTPEPEFAAMPPLMPQKAAWRELVMGTPGGGGGSTFE